MTDKRVLENTIQRCRERDIIIPTYDEMAHPEKIPEGIRAEMKDIGLWDIHPRNLFRITWKNEPVSSGGPQASFRLRVITLLTTSHLLSP